MAESFKLSSEHTQKATLGCGTLILIALIVAIFSHSGSRDVERDVEGLRGDMHELKKSIDAQSQQIREPKPHTVTPASSRYPQMLYILTRFWRRKRSARD